MRVQCLALAAFIAVPATAFAPASNNARIPTNLMGMHQIRREPCALELPKGPIPNLETRDIIPPPSRPALNMPVSSMGAYKGPAPTGNISMSLEKARAMRKAMTLDTLPYQSKGPSPAIPERAAPARKPAMAMDTLPTQSVGPAPGASERPPPSRPALNMKVSSMGAYKGPASSGNAPVAWERARATRKAMAMDTLPTLSKGPAPGASERAPPSRPALNMPVSSMGAYKGPAPTGSVSLTLEKARAVRKAMTMDTLPTLSKGPAPGSPERAPPSRPALNMPVSSMGPYKGSVPSKAAPAAAAPAAPTPVPAAPTAVAPPAPGPPKSYGLGGGGKKVGKPMGSYLNNL